MSVRAKFKVDSVSPADEQQAKAGGAPPDAVTVVLSPVPGGDPTADNRKLWNATPSGKIELTAVNPDTVRQLEVGKEFYLDFNPVG